MTSIHPLARIESGARIGAETRVWANAHVRTGADVGPDCVVGAGVFIDTGVVIGARCKIQNNAQLYEGVTLADGVFVGPAVVFTNDRMPRAVTPTGALKGRDDWDQGLIRVGVGAAVGARSVVVTGAEIGDWAVVGAGAVVADDVAPYALVVGTPARQIGWVSAGGIRVGSQAEALARSEQERNGEDQ